MPAISLKTSNISTPTNNKVLNNHHPAIPLTTDIAKSRAEPVYRAIRQWRYLLYRNGLVQPVVAVHTLHGFSLTYALKPAAIPDRSGHYYYPLNIDGVTLYQYLLKCQLSLKTLAEVGVIPGVAPGWLSQIADNPNFNLEQLDLLMTGLALGQEQFDTSIDAITLAQIQEAVSVMLNEVALAESPCVLESLGEKALTLLAYLSLYRDGKSYERLNGLTSSKDPTTLTATGSTAKDRANFTLIMWRANEKLREGLQVFVNIQFGSKPGLTFTLDLDFMVEDRITSIVRLDEEHVWVDGWQLDQLATRFRCTPDPRSGVACLEQAYQLVHTASRLHSYGLEAADNWNGIAALDDYPHTCLNLLGVFGERLNRKLELLELPTTSARSEYYLDLWYLINLKLAGYYLQQQEKQPQFRLNRGIEHLVQCQLTRPDEPEPILALLKITHHNGNLSKFNRVYRHYQKCCQEIELQPDEAIQAFYNQVISTRHKSIQTTHQSATIYNNINCNNTGSSHFDFTSSPFLAAS